MKKLVDIVNESIKPENGLEWEVYFNNSLDTNFTEWAKNGRNFQR